MPNSVPPRLRWKNIPTLNHDKETPYVEFPVVYEAVVANEPFYVDYSFTISMSDPTVTTLHKWNGVGWTDVTGMSNPEHVFGRGWFSVTTTSAASVSITEHVYGAEFEE